ncbi:MAG: hypothetical protein NTW82_14240, partial [Bacteroidia bacterium]|nr:hypothetical protein [Bacteroidia bacterium]
MSPGAFNHALNLSGATNTIGTLTTDADATTVTYNRAGDQTVFASPNYRNLTVSGGGNKVIQGNVTVSRVLTLNTGIVRLNDYDLILTRPDNATVLGGAAFGVTNMIETNGLGHLIRSGTLNNNNYFNITYPVGSGSPVYYNPFIITNLPAGGVAPRSLSVRTTPVNPGILTNSINRTWELVASGITTQSTTVFSFAYNNGEIVGDPLLFQPYTNSSDLWALATLPSVPGSNPATSTGSSTITGSWTVGSANTYYSYQTGFWDLPSTWTFDPGGTTGPGSTVPSQNDKVVILSGRTVTLQANDITPNLDITINNGGIIDQGTFRFANTFNALRGPGTLKLSSSDFPAAVVNTFVTTDGGTTEYNHNDIMSSAQTVYYHLSVKTAGTVTLISNITLNGDLNVKQGTFSINNGTARRINLVIKGNLNVDSPGAIITGTGGTNTTTNPRGLTGSTSGFLNYYELESHRIQVYGDFTNNGSVRFTNLTYPVYNKLASNGFATLYFNGSSDRTITCNGQTIFYNLVVDKGSGQTYKLTINSSDYSNFRLYGANIAEGSTTLPDATDANPNLKKALWIKNGTLVLKGLTVIPSLSEGAVNTWVTSDFIIPANGALILDGAGAIVQSTADSYTEINAAYGLAGGTDVLYGINPSGGNSGLIMLGKLQVNNGYLSTRESSGLLYYSYASGQFIQNGGKVDTKQFHNPEGGTNSLVSYLQTGGEMLIRGRFTNIINYTSPDDLIDAQVNTARALNGVDNANPGIGAFSICNNAANGFSMGGGMLSILDVCNPTTALAYVVNCPASNINVTGGTVKIVPTNGSVLADADYLISTTGPISDLIIDEQSGTSVVSLNTYPLTVLNDLTITEGDFVASNLDVTVGGNFSIASGTTYTAGTNTTTFNGSGDQTFTINIAAAQTLNNLTITKPAGKKLTFAGSQTTVNVTGDFRLVAGIMNDNGNTINIAGNLFNSGIH